MSLYEIKGGKPPTPPTVDINHTAVARLKAVLALFEAGESLDLAMIWSNLDGTHSNMYSGDHPTYILGAVTSLQHRIVQDIRGGN
jgi:acetylornithine deacetylase/succinyl-diaminopimelate desuccinylase-like protein